ncbi:MAG: nitrile hydratase subunit alpha [Pseudomonadota bacterium]
MPHDDPSHPHSLLPSDPALRVKALETLLIRKGLVDPQALDAAIESLHNQVGPQSGALVVARAWTDPEFKARLLADAMPELREMDITGPQGEHMVVVENTPEVHNMVVCTLCSCYPWPLLGIPPVWYKSDAYRSRAVREPRKVLSEFGFTLDSEQSVRVWDSTAEIRYLVLPMQPPESVGLGAEELALWVTRDSMIGTALPERPQ